MKLKPGFILDHSLFLASAAIAASLPPSAPVRPVAACRRPTCCASRSPSTVRPYAHVGDGVKYPAVIVYAGANEQRIDAWEPAQLAVRAKPILLRADYDASHTCFAATRRQAELNTADMIAVAVWEIGERDSQPKVATPDQQ